MTDVHSAGEFYSAFPERRINPFRPEVRMIEGEGGHIVGYASVFNKLSRKLGGFVEKVAPRAFNQSKAHDWPDVVCRYNHSDDWLLGTTKARTCLLQVDGDGLWYDVIPPEARKDVVELCRRGDVSSSSFAFRVPDGGDSWGLSDFSYPLRTLESVELVDVAPVITPAYPDATAASRALDGAIESLSRYAQAEPSEIRSLLAENMGVKLFKRTDRSPAPAPVVPEAETADDDSRAKLTAKARKALPKSAFAYVDDEGTGHFPIHDANHVRNALARIAQGAQYGQLALPKVKAAAKKFGIDTEEQNSWALLCAEERDMELPEWFATTEAEEGEEMAERAAKANYEDLETCAECGSKSQYGKHCTNCGKPMAPDSPMSGKFCSNCGGKTDGKRSEHECDAEERAKAAAAKPSDDEEEENPEDEGDAPEEDAAPSDEEVPEEPAEAEVRQPEGTSDNGHTVSTAEENRNRLTELLGKRYDPYFFEDEA